jgi:hypothetical protein
MRRDEPNGGEAAMSEPIIDRMIDLFNDYAECFGLSDADFPGCAPQHRQCDFEDKFRLLICEHKGHDIGPDQCGKPEHDLCYRCRQLRTEIESKEAA